MRPSKRTWITALSILLAASICRWIIAPYVQKLPDDFSYTAKVFSIDNFYDEKEERFSGEILSVTKFSYDVVRKENGTLIIKNIFAVRKPSGENIFSVERYYGINPATGAHGEGKGDQKREGFLFAPKNLHKEDFSYWHVNYNAPARMKFQEEEIISGLKVYRYACSYKADQTENLSFLPNVPHERGVELDIYLQTWVDPLTGWLVKYEDNTTAWYYDSHTKKRLQPWNKFHNEFNHSSIIHQVQTVKNKHSQIKWFTIYLPILLCFAAVFVLAVGIFREPFSKRLKPAFIALIITAIGTSISLLIYYNQSQNNFERQVEELEESSEQILANFKKELDVCKDALEMFRFEYQLSESIDRKEFAQTANYVLKKSASIRAMGYTPYVKSAERKAYEEKAQREGFPDFHFTERTATGEYIIAQENDFYLPLYFIEPYENNKTALGYNLSSESNRLFALNLAKETNDLTVTAPIVLLQEEDQRQLGIIIYDPLFVMDSKGEKKLAGYFSGVFSLNVLINSILSSHNIDSDIGLKIIDVNATLREPLFSTIDPSLSTAYDYAITKKFSVLNREWAFSFYSSNQKDWTLMAFLIVGIGFSLAIAVIMFRILTDNTKELRMSNERFIKVFNSSPGGNIIFSAEDTKIIDVNESYAKLIEYKKEEIIGRTASELELFSLEEQKRLLSKLIRQGYLKNEEMIFLTKTKKQVEVLFSTEFFETGGEKFILSSLYDITERKRAEEQFKNLIESAPDAVITINEEGVILNWNKQAEVMFELKESEVLGKSLAQTIIPERYREQHTKGMKHFLKTGEGVVLNRPIEIYALGKDSVEFPVELKISSKKLNDSYVFIGFIRDITERKKAEEKLIEAQDQLKTLAERLSQHNKQLVSFAHITSHNLRSPVGNLNALLSFYKESTSKEEQEVLISKVETVVKHLGSTLNELIDVLKAQEDTNRRRDHLVFEEVFDKIKEMLEGQIMETKAIISKDFSKAPEIDYPRHYLESILLNLFSNAIKYRSKDRIPEIHFETSKVNGSIILFARDNGLGMDLKQYGDKLFGLNKTFHEHPEAKGYGLFITKTQVEAMGGAISAESEVNKGTSFKIMFTKKT